MAGTSKRRLDAPTIGLILASLTAVASLAMVALIVFRGPASPPEGLDPGDPPPDITILGANSPTNPGGMRGRGLVIEFTDKDDPTRLAGVLEFDKLDPLPRHNYEVTKPRAWVFLDDGRIVHVRAPAGHLFMPDDEQPQSGSFTGGVEFRLFDPAPDGARPDIDRDTPTLLATTPDFQFDFSISEAIAPGRLEIRSEALDFIGTNVRAKFNETLQRIDYLEVRQGELLALHPRNDSSPTHQPLTRPASPANTGSTASTDSPVPGAPASRATPVQSPARPKKPRRVFYHVVMRDTVRIDQQGRQITADRLDLWALLIDNKLADNALGSPRKTSRAPARPVSAQPRNITALALQPTEPHGPPLQPVSNQGNPTPEQPEDAAPVPLDTPPAEPDTTTQESDAIPLDESTPPPDDDETVTIHWTGPLVLTALPERPASLKKNDHVAVRLTAEETGLVRITDESSGALARCARLEYYATRRDLILTGLGPTSVTLTMPGSQQLEVNRLRLNLGTGIAHIPGPGVARSLGEDSNNPARRRQLSWTEQADIELAMNNGRVTGAIRWAHLFGDVEVTDGDARLRGSSLEATFQPADDFSRSVLRRVDVVGPVEAQDGRGGSLTGDRLTLDLAMREGEFASDPDAITIDGNVTARRDDAQLTAQLLYASLAPDPENHNRIEVRFVRAREDVVYTARADDIEAHAQELRADAQLRRVDLEGPDTTVRWGTSTIAGTQIHLNDTLRVVEVFGAGTFTHLDPDDPDPANPLMSATWTRQMRLDDRAGRLDCYGLATARWRPDAHTTDDASAEQIHIEFVDSPDELAGNPSLAGAGDRQVRLARLSGGVLFDEAGPPAVIQFLREAAEPDEDGNYPIEQLVRLEGPEIIADNRTGRVRVDQPGRLVVADLRNDDTTDPDDPGLSDQRGSALFLWDGSFLLDRPAGTIEMHRNVRMTHIRPADGKRTNLVCESLIAHTTEPEAAGDHAGNSTAMRAQLRSVDASGAVHLISGTRELLADRVEYDATTGIAQASANEGAMVTFLDAASPSPLSARVLWWNLLTDRIEVRQPEPITSPR